MVIDKARFIAGLTLCLFMLAACIPQAPPHNIPLQEIQAWKLESVDVVIAPDASVRWGGLELSPEERANPALFRQAAQRVFLQKAQQVLVPDVSAMMVGQRPVKLVLNVRGLFVPGFWQSAANGITAGILLGPWAVGGAIGNSELNMNAEIIDAKTNKVLLSYLAPLEITQGGQKIDIGLGATGRYSSNPIERLLTAYKERFVDWLLKK